MRSFNPQLSHVQIWR